MELRFYEDCTRKSPARAIVQRNVSALFLDEFGKYRIEISEKFAHCLGRFVAHIGNAECHSLYLAVPAVEYHVEALFELFVHCDYVDVQCVFEAV